MNTPDDGIDAALIAGDRAVALVTAAMADDPETFDAVLEDLVDLDDARRTIFGLVGLLLSIALWIDKRQPGRTRRIVQLYALGYKRVWDERRGAA